MRSEYIDDLELSSKRRLDAEASVEQLLSRYPAEPSKADRKLAERVLEAAVDVGLEYRGNLARLASLVYAPPKLGTRSLIAAQPNGLVR